MKLCKYINAYVFIIIFLLVASNGEALASIQCYDCHGTRTTLDNRPEDASFRNISSGGFQGNHQKHLGAGATASSCQKCHSDSVRYGADHRNGTINLSGNINASVHPSKARYKNSTSSAYLNYTSFPQTSDKTGRFFLGSCSNVNCHFESSTPAWGTSAFSAPDDCNRCHGVPPAGTPGNNFFGGVAGSHERHNVYYSGVSQCNKCHADHSSFEHATSAGRGLVIVPKDPLGSPGGSYDRQAYNYLPSQNNTVFGRCSDLYCHSNAAPSDNTSTRATPRWGDTQTCSSCHVNSGMSLRHGPHISNYTFSCDNCHSGTVNGSSSIKSTVLHVNKEKDVTFKDGGNFAANKECTATYCHSDAAGGAPGKSVKWSDTDGMTCYSCHKGRFVDSTPEKCAAIAGVWSSTGEYCTPGYTMSTDGHARLAGPRWIRKYACSNCHSDTVTAFRNSTTGKLYDGEINKANHVNSRRDVSVPGFWAIPGKAFPSYSSVTRTCYNVYCHSDGTVTPPTVNSISWNSGKTDCNSCHGHPNGNCSSCHDGRTDTNNKTWILPASFGNATAYKWPAGEEWKAAIPMFHNEGAGSDRANSHPRHVETSFSCDECHVDTVTAGVCGGCHEIMSGKKMSETSHINPAFHVNKKKDVRFKSGGNYKPDKSCSGTACHTGISTPVWGGSVNSSVICLDCHGNKDSEKDTFGYQQNTDSTAKINTQEWYSTGHGRRNAKGPYPSSGNPAANFSGNACWYCHDNNVIHNDKNNFFRLREHPQFKKRFEKECVYCHMQGTLAECLNCHKSAGSLSLQLANISSSHTATARWANRTTSVIRPDHRGIGVGSCLSDQGQTKCHTGDAWTHNTGPNTIGSWTTEQKDDIRNQYMMMGVCLQCHDDDSNNKCLTCHSDDPARYAIGFRPPGFATYSFIKPKKARATSAHFGYKHYRKFLATGGWEIDPGTKKPKGTWRGGKFCWDCHDPHGDSNIYMIQKEVATSTDGKFGIPITRKVVSFTKKVTGNDYAKTDAPFNGICNVCHTSSSRYYTSTKGETHNQGRICTNCHEHRFSDSHGDAQSCNTCHKNKPVPRHSGFGLPRDCTKCHSGAINKRMDIMGQMNGVSHHVQGTAPNNKHCYQCHWESTKDGIIDLTYHTGYNYRNYTTIRNEVVDLVLWQPGATPTIGVRPERYELDKTAMIFRATNMANDDATARSESAKLNNHCLSCHSDQNNDNTSIFGGDCRTPRQYAWDALSIAARYLQAGTTKWGKYNSTSNQNVTKKDKVIKAFSAHGNAINNSGGFNNLSGYVGTIPNTRGGTSNNVQCYDCHSSHGSQVTGVTSSYITFNGTKNGGNLKETQANKGGYAMSYKASNEAAGAINQYSVGAAQCFDCHNSQTAGITPWGYTSTYGASSPVRGYFDSDKFGQASNTGIQLASPGFKGTHSIKGGHMKASSDLTTAVQGTVNGLCTPCHDPHGVSPSLGGQQAYAVPLLKGTWLTSPYRDDNPSPNPSGTSSSGNGWGKPVLEFPEGREITAPTGYSPIVGYNIDRTTFGGSSRISEETSTFAGLCMQCHARKDLLNNYTGAVGTAKNASKSGWKSVARVHATVKGWGGNNEHSYTCSKCHVPHMAGLPRLMVSNCLDGKHRGKKPSGGQPWRADNQDNGTHAHNDGNQHRGYPIGNVLKNSAAFEAANSCHGSITDNPDRNNWPNNNGWNNNVTNW